VADDLAALGLLVLAFVVVWALLFR